MVVKKIEDNSNAMTTKLGNACVISISSWCTSERVHCCMGVKGTCTHIPISGNCREAPQQLHIYIGYYKHATRPNSSTIPYTIFLKVRERS